MMRQIFWLAVITMIPLLELRASIPFGLFRMGGAVPWQVVVAVCVVANILLGWLIFLVLGPVFQIFRKWSWFERIVWPFLERTRHRIHPYVEKYGELGVAVFIGIPLPGSGVYTGALGAYLLGVDRRKFIVANVIGVFIAAAAVTAICQLILHGVVGENSWAARLFIKKGL